MGRTAPTNDAHAGERAGPLPIAIVGIGCRFPGGADSPAAFWRILRDGLDVVGDIPASRMDIEALYDARPATPGRIATRHGGYLAGIEDFDADFFGISPRQAERLDPQHRLLLETAWEALEDAGLDTNRVDGSTVGVFVGQWLDDFERRLFADPEAVDFHMTTGSGRYASSGRLSYMFGFSGPSLTIDTACSSSLAAVMTACRSIHAGESTMALAAGVNVILAPQISVAYSQSQMLAPDGRCKFADARADGYVRSEGCGVLVLRPLADALAANDRVYAVIRGGALNNDGRSSGSFGTPSREGQRRLIERAYSDARVAPERVRYVEAHGTGTLAGDPVELDALNAVLGAGRAAGRRLLVGSVKTNIGHTEGAAGMAGIIKVAMAMRHDAIPASLHLETPNPSIPWASLPIDVPRALSEWPAGEGTRIAGVSGFGIAGSNGHVVLEEAPASSSDSSSAPAPARAYALPLSARSSAALAALAGAYADALGSANAPALPDLCLSAALHRTALPFRAVFVGDDATSLIDRLRRFASGEREAANAAGEAPETAPSSIAFVFPGQGSQWVGMARELLKREPAFRDAIEACETAMAPFADWSLREQLELDAESPRSRMNDIAVIQPVLVAVEVALASLWRAWGVEPTAVVGHSMGEVGAAYVAGALSLEDAMRVICHRSALLRRTSGRGAMGLVELSAGDATARIAAYGDRLSVAVHNAPRSTVVSGDPDALRELLASLEADGIFCRQVKVDVASHSRQMDPLVPELLTQVASIRANDSSVAIYSTVTGSRVDGHTLDATYWGRNLREPVQFSTAVSAMTAAGVDAVIELSPHPVLTSAVLDTSDANRRSVAAVGSLRREEPEQAAMLTAIGALWAAGYAVDWARTMPVSWRRVSLPTYPWQRQRYWHSSADVVGLNAARVRSTGVTPPSDESLAALYSMVWEEVSLPDAAHDRAAGSEWLLVGDDIADRAALADELRALGAAVSLTSLSGVHGVLAASATTSRPLTIVCFADASANTPFTPLELLQRIDAHQWNSPPKVWFATRGAQSVAGTERVSAPLAAFWGAARCVAEEQPRLGVGLVDLAGDETTSAALIARALLAGDGEDQVALRAGKRHALRLQSLPTDSPSAAPSWRADAAYLVTGGLGDIGLRIAHAMVDAGARRLVLLGRTPLPARAEWNSIDGQSRIGRRVNAVRALEAKGAAVHILTADVGDANELARALDGYAREAWPAIRGIVHAAGLLDNRLADTMDRATFDRVVNPKLNGALHLDRLLPDVDLFVLFSSTGGFLVQPGQANYAAANAGLDGLAHDRRARGKHALSIAWGVWAGLGLVSGGTAERNVEEMSRQGIKAFSADQGVALFHWLLRRNEAMVTVLPVVWSEFRRARAGRGSSVFRRQLEGANGEHDPSSNVAASLRSAQTPLERRRVIDGVLRDAAARVLRLPPSRLDARRPLGSVGLDSLMALELRNRLQATLERSLPATLLWNYPTLDALGDYLSDEPAPGQAVPSPGVSAPAVAIAVADVSQMSDDDAAKALRAPRQRGRSV